MTGDDYKQSNPNHIILLAKNREGLHNLYRLVLLKEISNALFRRVSFNYRFVIGYNMGLILLGLFGILPPGVSALLHNTSTLGIGLHSMTNLLPEEETCERISEKRSQSLASA